MKDSTRRIIAYFLAYIIVNISVFNFFRVDFSAKYNGEDRYNLVTDFYNFEQMYTTDYNQAKYESNCGPTMFCNVISYYEMRDNKKYIPKVEGKVGQELYDVICDEVKFNKKDGTKAGNLVYSIEDYFDNNFDNLECEIDFLYLYKWDKLKEYIDKDKVLLLFYNDHVYMIGGYIEVEDVRNIEVFTEWEAKPFMSLKYEPEMSIFAIDLEEK